MTASSSKTSVLFVCMGNICRSPTAEGVFRHFVEQAGLSDNVEVDSAGTHAYHVGEPPDHRAQSAAERRGYSLHKIRARRVSDTDFESFDYVVAMDRLNMATLRDRAEPEHHAKISLFLEYTGANNLDVPDPYYGGAAGFERVLDMVEDASRGLLEELKRR